MLDKAKEDARLALDEADKDAQVALYEAKKEARLARDKANKDAKLALDKAKEDLRFANLSLEECRAENNALKFRVKKSRSIRNTSGHSASNSSSKDTSPRCSNCTIKSSPKPVQVPPAYQIFGYFDLGNDMRLISAAQEALVALSSSPTPPSVAVESGSSAVSTGTNMPSNATNQVTAATTSVAGENRTTLETMILDRSPTPPLLYLTPSPPSSPTIV